MSRAIAVTAALAVLLVVGCGGAERGESGETIAAGSLSVFSFSAGDCFNGIASEEETESVEAIPCDQPHEAEVYLLVDYPGGNDATYPAEDAIEQLAEGRCLAAFEPYVRLPYDLSEICSAYLYPTKDSWERRDDREIVCLLYYEDGRNITGSLRGARR